LGLEPRADLVHPLLARLAVGAGRLHLDELVRLQRAVDLGDDFFGETLVADDHEGIELVRLRSQLAASRRGEFCHAVS
jgi:hypothetical protein